MSSLQPQQHIQNQSLLQFLKKEITWKHTLFATITAFVIYPKPFLYLLRPIIKRVSDSYDKLKPQLTRIILTGCKSITEEKVIKMGLFQGKVHNVFVINLLQDDKIHGKGEADENWDSSLDTQASNTILRIKLLSFEIQQKNNKNFAILVKGKKQLLRIIEAKILGMDFEEIYKIPMFCGGQQEQIHILETVGNGTSFEQKVMKIPRQESELHMARSAHL